VEGWMSGHYRFAWKGVAVLSRDTQRAMSEENVELYRRATELFNRDGPRVIATSGLWAPELVYDLSPAGVLGFGVYRGRDEVIAWLEEDWFAAFPFEEWVVEHDELIDRGDQVIAVSHQRGRGASSGAATELEFAQIVTVENRRIVRIEFYLDPDKAFEAAGLRE
jgi:ketosteroid isomerase-like protein